MKLAAELTQSYWSTEEPLVNENVTNISQYTAYFTYRWSLIFCHAHVTFPRVYHWELDYAIHVFKIHHIYFEGINLICRYQIVKYMMPQRKKLP